MTRRQFIRRTAFSGAGIAGTAALGSPLPNEFGQSGNFEKGNAGVSSGAASTDLTGRAATAGRKQRKSNVIFIITMRRNLAFCRLDRNDIAYLKAYWELDRDWAVFRRLCMLYKIKEA